jgi:hypothetical protein
MTPSLSSALSELRRGSPSQGGGARRIAARARLARLLWSQDGARRLPALAELDEALSSMHPDDLDGMMEFGPMGPLYLLPTREWCRALATTIAALGVRRVVEIGAGDGFLSACLARMAPKIEVHATDTNAWTRAEARMTRPERSAHAGRNVAGIRPGRHVERLEAREAIDRYRPELVLASWLPPRFPLSRIVRCDIRYCLEIGAAGGVTPGAWNWRYAHDFCDGPVEELARCRLDARPQRERHSRVTLYFGAAHPDHHCERVGPDHWLDQYRPAPARRPVRAARARAPGKP